MATVDMIVDATLRNNPHTTLPYTRIDIVHCLHELFVFGMVRCVEKRMLHGTVGGDGTERNTAFLVSESFVYKVRLVRYKMGCAKEICRHSVLNCFYCAVVEILNDNIDFRKKKLLYLHL